MPSGKKSKQRRRAAAAAPPPVRSKGMAGRRQANPRVLAAIGGAVVLIAIGAGLAVVFTRSSGGSNSKLPAVGSINTGLPGSADVEALFKGVPQKGLTLGYPLAPVTLLEYIDLQCPFCQQFETQVMPDIIQKYVRTKKVKVEARILDFIGPDSGRGRNAMAAAALQNKAFNYAEILYYNQGTENTGWLNDTMVGEAAASIPGLRVQDLLSARSSGAVSKQGKDFDAQAVVDKVTGTPTLFVGKGGQRGAQVPLSSPTDEAALVKALDAALAG